MPRDQVAAVALVDIEAGLVPAAYIDPVTDTAFVDGQPLGRLVTGKHTRDPRQTFLFPHRHVGTLVHVRATGGGLQGIHDRGLPRIDTDGHELTDQLLPIAIGGLVVVDDQTRQAVRLAENQPHRARPADHRIPMGKRPLHAALEECVVDGLGFVEAPDPRTDRGLGAVSRAGEKPTVVRTHDHRRTGRGPTLDAFDSAGEQPGMPAQECFLLAGLQGKDRHGSTTNGSGQRRRRSAKLCPVGAVT